MPSHEEPPVKPGGKVLRDTGRRLFDFDTSRSIDRPFRRATVWIEETGEEIELFYKAIKQNLRIKTFGGTSTKPVRIQI